ncbi:hypothetical protein D1872_270420 [compost metagenome]
MLSCIFSIPGTVDLMVLNMAPNWSGVANPTVSGRLTTVAPAEIAVAVTLHRNSISVRLASSAENSTLSKNFRPYRIAASAVSNTLS